VSFLAKKKFQVIDIRAFASVMFAAILIGFVVHEFVHLFLISNPSSITLWFGQVQHSVTVCCLSPTEYAFEELAYLVQFIATVLWIAINWSVYVKRDYGKR